MVSPPHPRRRSERRSGGTICTSAGSPVRSARTQTAKKQATHKTDTSRKRDRERHRGRGHSCEPGRQGGEKRACPRQRPRGGAEDMIPNARSGWVVYDSSKSSISPSHIRVGDGARASRADTQAPEKIIALLYKRQQEVFQRRHRSCRLSVSTFHRESEGVQRREECVRPVGAFDMLA